MITVGVYKLQASEFSEVIDLTCCQTATRISTDGEECGFLAIAPWHYWLVAKQTGFFPFEWQYFLMCSFGFLLPVLVKFPNQFRLVKQLDRQWQIIWKIIASASIWYCLSHLLLFRLHLPGRYSQHTWRIAIALLAGITLTILLHALVTKITAFSFLQPLIIIAIAICLLYPTYAVQSYPHRLGYVTGKSPELYQFLQQQPKNIVIATLSEEADFIPSLARRSVLTAREYSIPYHWDYYGQIRERTQALIQAQYSLNSVDLKQFSDRYSTDYWLIDTNAFTPKYLTENDWLVQFQPEVTKAIANLEQQPAIASKIEQCRVFKTSDINLLDGKCLTAD